MKKTFLLLLSLGLVLGLNIYFRIFPVNLPQLRDKAKAEVEENIRYRMSKEVDHKFPNLHKLAKVKLVGKFVLEHQRRNASQIKEDMRSKYLSLKDEYQDPGGQTYLMELDCWHWARYTENVYRHGYPGDAIVNGRSRDTLMLAPYGSNTQWNTALFYISAWLYRPVHFLYPSVPLYTFLFYLPLFFMLVFITLLYLFCFYRWGNLGAMVTCIFVGLNALFLNRSCAGWFDTDILNLLFPLLICWTYIKAYLTKGFWKKLTWLAFSGFWLGVFSFTWGYWWFIFFIIAFYETYSCAAAFIPWLNKGEKAWAICKQRSGSFLLFTILGCFWVVAFSGLEPLSALYLQLKGALSLNSPLQSFWPNVFATVDELRPAGLRELISLTGGVEFFIFSFVCLCVFFVRTLRHPSSINFARESAVIMFFWGITMLLASLRGIRFIVFALIPLGIALGWIVSEAYQFFKKRHKVVSYCILAGVLIFGKVFISKADKTAKDIFPLMTDGWYNALISLQQKTPKEAIVNALWDYGDWIKAVAKRKVIFDGQSQNIPQAYWLTRALMSDNEEEAVGILRMLDNAGNRAFEIIDQGLHDQLATALLLKKVIISGPEDSKKLLAVFLSEGKVNEVIKLVFTRPPQAYLLVDGLLIGKTYSNSFLGNWDFAKMFLIENSKKKRETKDREYLVSLGIDREQAEREIKEKTLIEPDKLNEWVSQRLAFHSPLLKGQEKDNIILFEGGLVYSLKEKKVYYCRTDGEPKIPKSLFIFEQGRLEEVIFPDSNLDYSALVFKDSEGFKALLLDRQLAGSIFVRLYFLKGEGLKYFKPAIEEKDQNGYIRIFEIIWS